MSCFAGIQSLVRIGVKGCMHAGGDEPLSSCSGEKKARQAGQPAGVFTATCIADKAVVVIYTQRNL